MHVEISEQAFSPWRRLEEYQAYMHEQGRALSCGATAIFIGTMRTTNRDEKVTSMYLEHYAEMTHPYIERFVQRQCADHSLEDALVIHRAGMIYPGDTIVLVAVWAAHRELAYRANRLIMEELKTRAPLWKKEQLAHGSRWLSDVELQEKL